MTHPPDDRGEAVALFRLSVLGDLVGRDLEHGELRAELVERAKKRWRAPGAKTTRRIGASTIERWYYAYLRGGYAALRPQPRSDRGRAQEFNEEQRRLICSIRREHPSASVPLILRTLVAEGLVERDAVSASTVRRLLAEQGLVRAPRQGAKVRRRWQAARPGQLWHGDVCHALEIDCDGTPRKALVHGFLDDASRYLPMLEARWTETEQDMLDTLCTALLRFGPPRQLYLDNGSCYSGDLLKKVCARLEIKLIHAQPYDAPARGKMERVWRTLREQCIDHLSGVRDIQHLNTLLWAWSEDYHARPHAGLMGKSPRKVLSEASEHLRRPVDRDELIEALRVQTRRKVRKDNTLSIDGTLYEVVGHHLVGRYIDVTLHPVTHATPTALFKERAVEIVVCNPEANARMRRSTTPHEDSPTVDFHPTQSLLKHKTRRRNK